MREHPLVPKIRFYLLCGLALLAACVWQTPEPSVVFFATGFGWWKGCGCCSMCSTCTCPRCVRCLNNAGPCKLQVVITGVNNALCTDCANWDTTITTNAYTDSDPNCSYQLTSLLSYCSSAINFPFFTLTNSGTKRRIQLKDSAGQVIATVDDASNTDGTTCSSISYSLVGQAGPSGCTFTTGTYTLTGVL